MKKVLFFGNCQLAAIQRILRLDPKLFQSHVIPVHANRKVDKNKEEFTKFINQFDIIITQPIRDDFGGVDYYNTNYIIHNARKEAKIIIFHSCYFRFYYPDLKYIYLNNRLFQRPHDYHYQFMIDTFKSGSSVEDYITNCVNNENLITENGLLEIARKSIAELKSRAEVSKKTYVQNNVSFISVAEFIEENYRKKLLFYSMNHPTKFLLQYIAESIVKLLNITNTINYGLDPLGEKQKSILYKCVQKVVDFDIHKHDALTLNHKNIASIASLYYNEYTKINMNDISDIKKN